ncbi:LysM peptidoglycan-binding domain-containing protein [uncultured Proteiniphilum sp.]|uniref:LysM peptidoglycan-binding domain-containing protein n=1 Tax=uncultured Proteiniphilum sp. TaxID=497637 RepID=UPI0026360A74|nr:LysM peptidoglycan-binding domain-containing protein [uncultured Proteiniphilum sp.]
MKRTILIALITVWGGLSIMAQETPPADLENIQDSMIVYPESMMEKLSDLLRNWQLDLSNAEVDCKRGQNITFHDSVYLKRLHNLPSEMELSFNSVVKSYIEMYAVRKREQVSYMLALGDYYYPMFEQALDSHGLPLELKYLPVIESALNPVAVSRAGATGLWQFMLRTGKGYGLEVNSLVDERRDPYKSTDAAVRYLKDLYAIYGDWNLVIAAYNCGPGNVNKAIARSGGKRDYWEIYYFLPRETRGYVPAFIAANYIMSHYADHNICPAHSSSLTTIALDTVQVNERIHLEQIAGVLDIPVSELRRLNPQFRKDVIPGDFRAYALVLPSEKMYAFIDKNDTIVNYEKGRYFTHRANTDGFLDGSVSSVSGNTANVYYRVKKGDNLSAIARRNGTTVTLIKSWNGLRSNRIDIGKQLIVGQKEVAPEADQQQLVQVSSNNPDGETQTINRYYRVRKGDTLGEIARKNGVQVAQLQSWNGLRSSSIGIGDQLIIGKKAVAASQEDPESGKKEYTRAETSRGSNIISSYLQDQLEKVEQNRTPDGQEEETEKSVETTEEKGETATVE